jgi:proline dehydrogenase
MVRALLIYLSKADWVQRLFTRWGAARRMAARFVAGEQPEDAIRVVKALNDRGITATIDHLGEYVSDIQAARQAAAEILHLLELIQDSGVQANISLKLTQLGIAVEPGICRDHLLQIVNKAHECGNFIRLDMEDTPWTDRTLQMYSHIRQQGFDNLGVVIQAYLNRSQADLERLSEVEARVRLCKGAYQEPPHLAFPRKADVDANYDRLVEQLLRGAVKAGSPARSKDGRFPPIPAIATHDPQRIRFALECAQLNRLPGEALEFQMLYGIRRDLQAALVGQGYPVRVYVPYGRHWYPYFMRRLAERPANLWFFISNFFRT